MMFMKKDTWDIQHIAKHFMRKQRRLSDHRLMHPRREWFVGLLALLVLLIAGISYQAYNFMYFSDIDKVSFAEDITRVDLSSEGMEEVLTDTAADAETFASIVAKYSRAPVEAVTPEVATTTAETTEDTEPAPDEAPLDPSDISFE